MNKKIIGGIFIICGLAGLLLSIALGAGTVFLVSKHYAITTLSLLILILMTICSTLTLGVGISITIVGRFP